MFFFTCILPVSYTHLDVYKRQLQARQNITGRQREIVETSMSTASKMLSKLGNLCMRLIREILGHCCHRQCVTRNSTYNLHILFEYCNIITKEIVFSHLSIYFLFIDLFWFNAPVVGVNLCNIGNITIWVSLMRCASRCARLLCLSLIHI